ncbi:hypothetical protein [Leptospira adleri]|uniref:hypothetical protein n=1 Tax=Leptospira adleri TaxID=2023186 RepID=UPI0010829656|nr:hypothetical protein [Leptospira adleri]TGM52876.1 hypothetical protein EHQ97_13235 [Leptospira adleri]
MSFDNLEKAGKEIKKLAKKHTRDRSKKQFDEELFEGHFFQYIKEKEINSDALYDIACYLMAGENFSKDLAFFIIRASKINKNKILHFLNRHLSILNEEQTNIALSLIEEHKLIKLYYPIIRHLKLNSFYDSESLRKRIIYMGILFNKKEGYDAFHNILERELLITDSKWKKTELYTGNILFLFVVNKNYESIKYIFQRYSNQKTKKFLKNQLFIAANRWDQSLTLRLILRKIIIAAYLKNFFYLK